MRWAPTSSCCWATMSPGVALTRLIPGQRMGAGACPVARPARRSRHPWQPRLVGGQDGAARRAGARSPGHPLEPAGIPVYENDVVRLTKRPAFWLAGLGDQLAFLPAALSAAAESAWTISRDPCQSDRRRAGYFAGARARCRQRVPERVSPASRVTRMAAKSGCSAGRRSCPRDTRMFAYGHVREPMRPRGFGRVGMQHLADALGVPPEIVLVTLGRGGPAIIA